MNTYNPDVLLCLANLSNDEVFTPPQLANEVLDLLPKEIWKDKNAKFLDPCCKTGVFLREITIRLIEGLKDEIPDLQERVNHILTHQVYGIAITELTALTTRRTLYCSKDANGEYSVCTTFGHPGGNIYYRRIEHDWKNGKCSSCGASQKEFDRSVELETHAYAFIHKPIEELFNVKFDVIIGNPPYQLSCGKSSDMPLYHRFVEKAKELNPKYITMIIPSRWFSGGKGLDLFRKEMLNDLRIRELYDFKDSSECFPSVDIEGGVCYFLWDSNYKGMCNITSYLDNSDPVKTKRFLLEDGVDTFLRDYRSVEILKKVRILKEDTFDSVVSAQTPFGLLTNFKNYSDKQTAESITIYGNKFEAFVSKDEIKRNLEWVDKYKIYISEAYGVSKKAPHRVLNKPFLGKPGSCCTQTYLVVGPFDSEITSLNVKSYMETKFFSYMVLMKKISQHNNPKVFSLVPMQDFSKPWTDQELYEKYGLTQDEIDYIEAMIRPMGLPEMKEE